ncbi:hypothetical protein BD309DRAFT_1023703 [Dichomitus squalens]|uniref:Uncharacterized protein n=1 Tax=Dichomitus squalens TaxID=114155 RepID=A0A4Q9PFU7_9APHY|nr:hypothetical protein BD309DRAFT_1023703 [Dichomitus squalens]TBU53900.1 hypothetical protein BD310DRAFT_980773 [Dichomitus squalens]
MLEERPFALLDHWRSLPIRACLHLETLVVTFCNVPADDSELRTQGYRKASLEANLELVNSAPPSLTLLLVQFGNGDTDEMSHVRSWDLPDFALYWSSLDNAIMRLPVLQVVAFAFSPPQVVEWATSHERTIFINSNNSNPPLELGPEEDAACKAFLESALPQTYAKGLIKLVLKDETIGSFAADRTNR